MKYQSEHGFTHPVLSPESDHYLDGRFATVLHQRQPVDGNVSIDLDFQIEEPSLEGLVKDGKAQCVAMLYCRATLHQQTIKAENGSIHISALVSTELLRDAIELYPLLVATQAIELDTSSAAPFYRDATLVVQEGEPLATDRGWHFSLDADAMPLGSIFTFEPVPALTGPMEIDVDPDATYINIRVNADQFQKMNITRQQGLTIPTVFSAALVKAITKVQELPEDDEVITPGWVDTIRKQSKKHNIDLSNGGTDPFVAAQVLLGNPFADLTKYQVREVEEQPE